jgi:hypothetical protein
MLPRCCLTVSPLQTTIVAGVRGLRQRIPGAGTLSMWGGRPGDDDLPAQIVKHGAEDRGAENDERHCVEHVAASSMRYDTSPPPPLRRTPNTKPPVEAAVKMLPPRPERNPRREKRQGRRQHLKPVRLHQRATHCDAGSLAHEV